MGRDPDHPLALGEVGKCGVSVMSLADMEALFDGIDLGAVSTSMTINSPAPMLLAMYLVVAERQGVPWTSLRGTIQNDILKEFIAQKEFIYPPRPSMSLVTDIVAFCADSVPKWNTISVSGYHIREAARRRRRNWPSPCATGSSTSSMPSTPALTWTPSRLGFRSSSTRTTICSRRWRNAAPPGACGRT